LPLTEDQESRISDNLSSEKTEDDSILVYPEVEIKDNYIYCYRQEGAQSKGTNLSENIGDLRVKWYAIKPKDVSIMAAVEQTEEGKRCFVPYIPAKYDGREFEPMFLNKFAMKALVWFDSSIFYCNEGLLS